MQQGCNTSAEKRSTHTHRKLHVAVGHCHRSPLRTTIDSHIFTSRTEKTQSTQALPSTVLPAVLQHVSNCVSIKSPSDPEGGVHLDRHSLACSPERLHSASISTAGMLDSFPACPSIHSLCHEHQGNIFILDGAAPAQKHAGLAVVAVPGQASTNPCHCVSVYKYLT